MVDNNSFAHISEEAKKIVEVSNSAIAWVESHLEDVEKGGITNSIKKIRRDVKKIEKAASKRPSVAVFGQSQVGKSYLVQNLTKPALDTYLEIDVKGKHQNANFLTDINPVGGKESTGTVTRFTIASNEAPDSHPFKVELFSFLDIAAILTNSFHSDLKELSYVRADQNTESVQSIFAELPVSETNNKGFTEDDVHVFTKYISLNFKDSILIQDLIEAGYFTSLNDKLSTIQLDKCVKLLELLWNKDEFITGLFVKLTDALARLKFSNVVFVGESAIMPNDTTILDVARVNELYSDSNTEGVNAIISSGENVIIERSVFASLTKEVELSIANKFEDDAERSFIKLCDVLDFPGSKSRDKIPEAVFKSNPADQKLQLFIRGKVSYLFDNYLENQGVSSLIYCMDNHPPEEKEAPVRLKKWIDKYIGSNPNERDKRIADILSILKKEGMVVDAVCPLMVVLTKFNVELSTVIPGKELDQSYHSAKWQARLEENFMNFMHLSVDDKWVSNWTNEDDAFSYVFPMRDPLYSQTTFEGFDMDKKESRIRPEREETIKAMGSSFLSSTVVNELIAEPSNAWKEVTTPNGSGISHLCKYLNSATHPIVTIVRFEAELSKAKKDLLNALKPYEISGDITADLEKADRQANLAWAAITGISIKNDGSLNKILSSMVINDVEIWKLLYNFKFQYSDENTRNEEVDTSTAIKSLKSMGIAIEKGTSCDILFEEFRTKLFPGQSDDDIVQTVQSMMNIDINALANTLSINDNSDKGASFTEKVIEFWHGKMLSITQNDDIIGDLTEPQKDAVISVINEIVKGRNRFGLGRKISDIIDQLVVGTIDSKDFDLIASCCTGILNKFLFSSGWAFANEDEKPEIIGDKGKVFSQYRKTNLRNMVSKYDSREYSREFASNWSLACKHIYTENIKYQYNVKDEVNSVANSELVELIKEVSA